MSVLTKVGKSPYSYVVLRYFHDMVTGEFVNVGLVALDQRTQQLEFRIKQSASRVKGFFPSLDEDFFVRYLEMIEGGLSVVNKSISGPNGSGIKDARQVALGVLVEDDSAFQWSPLFTGISADFSKTVDALYESLVAQYDLADMHQYDFDPMNVYGRLLFERRASLLFNEHVVSYSETCAVEFSAGTFNNKALTCSVEGFLPSQQFSDDALGVQRSLRGNMVSLYE